MCALGSDSVGADSAGAAGLGSPLCLFGPGGAYLVGLSPAGALSPASAGSTEPAHGVTSGSSSTNIAGGGRGGFKNARTGDHARLIAYPGRGLVHDATRPASTGSTQSVSSSRSGSSNQSGHAIAPAYVMGSSAAGVSLSVDWWVRQCVEDVRVWASSVAGWISDACDRFLRVGSAVVPHALQGSARPRVSTRLVAVPIADVRPTPSHADDATRAQTQNVSTTAQRLRETDLPPVVLGPQGLAALVEGGVLEADATDRCSNEATTNELLQSRLYEENGCSQPLGSNSAGATAHPVELEVTNGPRQEKFRNQGQRQAAADPATASDPDTHTGLSAQSWLFPVDAGTGRRPADIEGHGVRARRHARRKRAAVSESAQGTLFGTDVAGSAA